MTAATVEATAPEATETEAVEETVDLSNFQAAVAAATTDVDALNETGNKDVHAVRRAYTDLGRKGKAAAKAWLVDQSTEAVMEDRSADAKKFMVLKQVGVKVLASSGGGTSNANKTAEKLLDGIKTLQIAYSLAISIAQNSTSPELADWENKIGVTEDDIAAARTYAEWIENPVGDEPDVSDLQKQGARVSLGRGPKGQGRKPGSGKVAADAPAEEVTADSLPE